MEVTSNLDAPTGWRSKMKMAEVVDAGIDFRNGLSAGYISINRYQNSVKNANGPNNTRPKQIPYLANNRRSGMNAIRVAGKQTGKIYS
jgi:hypothetical protein